MQKVTPGIPIKIFQVHADAGGAIEISGISFCIPCGACSERPFAGLTCKIDDPNTCRVSAKNSQQRDIANRLRAIHYLPPDGG